MLFLVRMLVERVAELLDQHGPLEGLRVIGGEQLVEDEERRVMLCGKHFVPVAGCSAHALHHRLATEVGRNRNCRTGDGRADQRPALAPVEGAAFAGRGTGTAGAGAAAAG